MNHLLHDYGVSDVKVGCQGRMSRSDIKVGREFVYDRLQRQSEIGIIASRQIRFQIGATIWRKDLSPRDAGESGLWCAR